MHIIVKRLPEIATAVYPTTATLRQGFQWYLTASERDKERYHETRLKLLRQWGPLQAPYQNQYTSGSTGRRKHYRWGPNFAVVDQFFYDIVRSNDRLGKTAHLQAVRIMDVNDANNVEYVEAGVNYTLDKFVYLNVRGHGPVPGLREALHGHNVFVSASMYQILEKYVNVSQYFDRDAMLIFTGEVLPEELRQRLVAQGWDVRDQMRCWDGGATFYTCPYGNKHWLDFLAQTWVVDGKLMATDYFNLCQPHVQYHNGDRLSTRLAGSCACGQPSSIITFHNRLENTCFRTPTGILANYEMLYDLLVTLTPKDDLTFVAFGKYHGDIDSRIVVHYLGAVTDGFANAVQKLYYGMFGMHAEVKPYVESSLYKVKKIYFLD